MNWCANECGYIDIGVIPKFAGCVNGVQWFEDRGQWAYGIFEPAPGMIIFFDWDSPDGASVRRTDFLTMWVLFRRLKTVVFIPSRETPAIVAVKRVILLVTTKSWDMVFRHIKRKHLTLGFTAWCGVLFVV